jgi:hypothetical protein
MTIQLSNIDGDEYKEKLEDETFKSHKYLRNSTLY